MRLADRVARQALSSRAGSGAGVCGQAAQSSLVCTAARCTAKHADRRATARGSQAAGRPRYAPAAASGQVQTLLAQQPARHALEPVHQRRYGHLGRLLQQQVHRVVLAIHLDEPCVEVSADLGEGRSKPLNGIAAEHPAPVLGDEDPVHVHGEDRASCHGEFMVTEEKFSPHAAMCRWFTAWRSASETAWLADAPIHSPQRTLQRLEAACRPFLAAEGGYPKFKRRRQELGLCFPDPRHNFSNARPETFATRPSSSRAREW